MPHTLESISGSNVVLVNEKYQTRFTKDSSLFPATLPFIHSLVSSVTPTAGPFGSGSSVVVHVPSAAAFADGEFVEVREGSNRDFTSIVSRNVGGNTITLKALANAYTVASKVYKVTLSYDKVLVVDPNVGCKEVTAISLLGTVRDQMLLRKIYSLMSTVEFDRMVAVLGVSVSGTRDEKIGQLNAQLALRTGSEPRATGPGILSPQAFQRDGGGFVSFSRGSWDDQFEEFTGTGTFDEYSFEVPFDCLLERVSVVTEASSDDDAYVTVLKNDVTVLVAAGAVPPDRNLPAVTGIKKGVDLGEVPLTQGEKITVRLNLVSANTVQRCKVTLRYAARLIAIP